MIVCIYIYIGMSDSQPNSSKLQIDEESIFFILKTVVDTMEGNIRIETNLNFLNYYWSDRGAVKKSSFIFFFLNLANFEITYICSLFVFLIL